MKRSKMLIMALSILSTPVVFAQESVEVKIERAMAAAPSTISSQATIMDSDGTLLREGTVVMDGHVCQMLCLAIRTQSVMMRRG